MDSKPPQKFIQRRAIAGPRVLLTSTWGCLLFFTVMLAGTWTIGHYFSALLKRRHDAELAAADKARSRSPLSNDGSQHNAPSSPSPNHRL